MRGLLSLLVVVCLCSVANSQCFVPGLKGTYYEGTALAGGSILTRFEGVNFDWGINGPGSSVPSRYFSVSWAGYLSPQVSGFYAFQIKGDDGFRLTLDGSVIISSWSVKTEAVTKNSTNVYLISGMKYNLNLEYFQATDSALIQLNWLIAGSSTFENIGTSYLSALSCSTPGIFITNTLTLQDNIGSIPFQVVLQTKPNSNVTISLAGNGLPLSICQIFFTPQNWSTIVNGIAYNDPLNNLGIGDMTYLISATASSSDPIYNNKYGFSLVTLINAISGAAELFSGSFMATFDDKRYTLDSLGDYYLIRQFDSELIIQARINACGTLVCATGVVIKYHSSLIKFFIDDNQVPVIWTNKDVSEDGVLITSVTSLSITLPMGVLLQIRTDTWDSSHVYLTISATVQNVLTGKILGLWGNFDQNAANDFMLVDESQAVDQAAFQAAWMVPQSENLFLNGSALVPTILGGSLMRYVTIQGCPDVIYYGDITADVVKSSKSLAEPLTNLTGVFPAPGSFSVSTPQTISDPNQLAAAQATCTGLYVNSELMVACAGFDTSFPTGFYENCLTSAANSFATVGTLGSLYTGFDLMNDRCQVLAASTGSYIGDYYNPVAMCPGNCNGNGFCDDGSMCECNSGFGGDDCSEDGNLAPEIFSSNPPEVGYTCQNQVVYISGNNLVGSTVQCLFDFGSNAGGVQTTDGTVVTKSLIKCPVPAFPYRAGVTPATTIISLSVQRDGISSTSNLQFTFKYSCCEQPCMNSGICIDKKLTNPFQLPQQQLGYYCQCTPYFQGTKCTENALIASNLCFSLTALSSCRNRAVISTEYCYQLTVYPRSGQCNMLSLSLASDCDSSKFISSSLPGQHESNNARTNVGGYQFNLTSLVGTSSIICVEVGGWTVFGQSSYVVETAINGFTTGTIRTPLCNADFCASNPCMNGAVCHNTVLNAGATYVCNCKPGFTGTNCAEIAENTSDQQMINIAAIVVSIVVVLIILAIVSFLLYRRHLKKQEVEQQKKAEEAPVPLSNLKRFASHLSGKSFHLYEKVDETK